MRKTPLLFPLLALGLASCAGMEEYAGAGMVFKSLIGERMSVGFPKALDFPEEMVLKLSKESGEGEDLGRSLFTAVAGGSIEEKAGAAIKKAGLPLREMTAKAFRDELVKAKLFGSVVDEGGDVALDLGISRWGLEMDNATGRILPVMDLAAGLSFKGVNVWRGTRTVAQVSSDVKSKLGGINVAGLLANAGNLKAVYQAISTDLSKQLIEEMRTRPPKARF